MKSTSTETPKKVQPPVDTAEWLIVLRADGVVDSVEGGAPITWLGQKLGEAPGADGHLRKAAAELMVGPPTSILRRRKVRCADGKREVDVEVLLVEALPLRRVHTHVHDLVMRTLDLFASQAKSNNMDLTISKADGVPPTIEVDSEKVAWALSALVANGLRYARRHVGVNLRWEESSGEMVFEVSDDGQGMPENKLRWLFERNPATGQSAGLALLMVRDVMTAHRGSLAVHSRVGHGTTFTLRIPRIRSR